MGRAPQPSPSSESQLSAAGLSRRRFLGLLGAAGGAAALAACAPGGGGSSTKPSSASSLGARPTSLKLLNAGSQSDADGVQSVLPMLKDALGINIQMENMPYVSLQAKTFAELASGSPAHDIYIMDTPWTPTLTHVLEPLSSYLTDDKLNANLNIDLTDFIPKVFYDTSVYQIGSPSMHFPDDSAPVDVKNITSKQFEILGLPIQSNALTLAYRKDLFDDPKEKAAFKSRFGRDLVAPVTWDDFVQVAQFFTRPSQGMYGATVLGGPQEGWDFADFKTMVGSFGGDGHIIDEHLAVHCATPQAIAAWQFYCDLIKKYKVTPPNATSAGWDQAIATFSSGKSAMTWNYGPQSMSTSVRGAEIAYAVIPKKVTHAPHFGTWQLSIPAKLDPNRKAWAYRAIAWLTSKDAQIAMLPTQLHATRTSVFDHAKNDPKITAKYGNFYSVLEQSLGYGVGRPRIKNYTQVVQPLIEKLNLAETGAGTVAAELKAAATGTVQTLKSIGYPDAHVGT